MASYIIGAVIAVNIGLITVWQNITPPEQKKQTAVSPIRYAAKLDSIHDLRDSLGKMYINSNSDSKKKAIMDEAKQVFLSALKNDIFESWYGTPWNFYGTTETPNNGSIACGYFVTTALRDMGVTLDRRELAECASETMIRKLVAKEYITAFRNKPVDEFVSEMLAKGDGLYIVGLDWHTGFLLCEGGKAWFIHSFPPGVRKEPPQDAPYLADSKYRVAGSITTDEGFFKRWILRESL